jgi:hypothetical protein
VSRDELSYALRRDISQRPAFFELHVALDELVALARSHASRGRSP